MIALVGILSPVIKVNAQQSFKGQCKILERVGDPRFVDRNETIEENLTREQCLAKTNPEFLPYGTCVGFHGGVEYRYGFGGNSGNQVTRENCLTGTFSPYGSNNTAPQTGYQLLAPLPCESEGCPKGELTNVDTEEGLGNYLNLMIKIFIGICAVLSVVMIVVGGLEVMTSELEHTKTAGKERIMHAVLGLLIALGAYALLYTINPDLLRSDLCVPPEIRGPDGKCTTPATPNPATVTSPNPAAT